MKLSQYLACLALATTASHAASLPDTNALSTVNDNARSIPRADILTPEKALEKRKGGGGKGGGGGGSSGGGKSGGGSSSGGSAGRTTGTSNVGGATRSGSGPSRAYGGAYGGGASTPYQAGKGTPKGLVAGAILVPAVALAILPGLWLYSVYPYHFNNPYRFYNESARNDTNPNGVNTTLPVTCLCQEYSVCGCDENDDQTYLKQLVGNGSYAALNKTLVTVSDVNGTQNLVINGTLPNGTTAPGGTDDDTSAAATFSRYSGYWVMVTIVLGTVAAL